MQQMLAALPTSDVGSLIMLGAIYGLAGIVSGLSGFGFSAIGCLSLIALPPQLAIAMLMALSLATQTSSFTTLWPALRGHLLPLSRRDGVLPYMAGGVLGLPIGLGVLEVFRASELLVGLGVLLVSYSVWSLAKPAALVLESGAHRLKSAVLVGVVGGVVGGFSAFPGSALVVWNGLVGTSKERGRALTQPYILFMQIAGLALLLGLRPQVFGGPFLTLFVAALPVALLGNRLGVSIFHRTGDLGYRKITLVTLGLAGLGLILKGALR